MRKTPEISLRFALKVHLLLLGLFYLPFLPSFTFIHFLWSGVLGVYTFVGGMIISILVMVFVLLFFGYWVSIWVVIYYVARLIIKRKQIFSYLRTNWFLMTLLLSASLNFVLIYFTQIPFKINTSYVIRDANKVATSLEHYKSEKGQYPESLALLVPEYLDQLPSKRFPAVSAINYRKKAQDFDLEFEIWYSAFETFRADHQRFYYISPEKKNATRKFGEETIYENWKVFVYSSVGY